MLQCISGVFSGTAQVASRAYETLEEPCTKVESPGIGPPPLARNAPTLGRCRLMSPRCVCRPKFWQSTSCGIRARLGRAIEQVWLDFDRLKCGPYAAKPGATWTGSGPIQAKSDPGSTKCCQAPKLVHSWPGLMIRCVNECMTPPDLLCSRRLWRHPELPRVPK